MGTAELNTGLEYFIQNSLIKCSIYKHGECDNLFNEYFCPIIWLRMLLSAILHPMPWIYYENSLKTTGYLPKSKNVV